MSARVTIIIYSYQSDTKKSREIIIKKLFYKIIKDIAHPWARRSADVGLTLVFPT